MRCLEKDPSARFPDARELRSALLGCDAAGLWAESDAARWWTAFTTEDPIGVSRSADMATEPEPNMTVDFQREEVP